MITLTPMPPKIAAWLDDDVKALRKKARRNARDREVILARADWFDGEGRDRLGRFVEEFRIASRIARWGIPVDSLRLNRIRKCSFYICPDESCPHPGGLPFLDHPHWWRDEDGLLILSSNPYATVETLEAVCTRRAVSEGLRVEVRPDLDFYSGGSPLVIWRAAA